MRIIGGRNRKRIITPPPNFRARPTTDFAKENLFNVVANYFDFDDIEVLDLFSGTGSISYEFCSRGAVRVVSVEMNPAHQKFISDMARELKYTELHSIKSNAFVYLKSIKDSFDIIFADPPYDMEGVDTIPAIVFENELLRADGWLIVEHSADVNFEQHKNFMQTRRYGSVNFSIFTNIEQGDTLPPIENLNNIDEATEQ